MKIFFLHGWQSTPGGLKPTYLKDHGHQILNPKLPDDDFEAAVRIAQTEFDQGKPDVVVGSSRGGAVAMNIDARTTPLVLLCPAWKRWGTTTTVKPGTTILHSRADETVPFADSEELVRNSEMPLESLIEVGTEHRLADPESLAIMLEVVERWASLRRNAMRIIGSDFTSDPKPGKPITVADCTAQNGVLTVTALKRFVNFQSFAILLSSEGSWVIGLDFPFGQPERLIKDLNWPTKWADYVRKVASFGKKNFRKRLDLYRKGQPEGEKEHFRDVDRKAKSISPMKMYGTPVGIMFCEGSPFLLASPASVMPFLPLRDPRRIILEAYPKLVATKVVGRSSYKTDNKTRVTTVQGNNRKRIISAIRDQSNTSTIKKQYGFHVKFSEVVAQACADDTSGDSLDAVLCAIQAAWAWARDENDYGIPSSVNMLEGWIADPELIKKLEYSR